jgi:hypothetical protein
MIDILVNIIRSWHVCRKPGLRNHKRQPLTSNASVNIAVAKQWISSRHVTAATDTNPTVQGQLEAVFSVQIEGAHVVSVTDPYGRNLGFLNRSRYFSSKYLLSCTHEADWTPFQTHYFSENPVA